MQAAAAELRVVPVTDAPWDDVRTVFGTRGDPSTLLVPVLQGRRRDLEGGGRRRLRARALRSDRAGPRRARRRARRARLRRRRAGRLVRDRAAHGVPPHPEFEAGDREPRRPRRRRRLVRVVLRGAGRPPSQGRRGRAARGRGVARAGARRAGDRGVSRRGRAMPPRARSCTTDRCRRSRPRASRRSRGRASVAPSSGSSCANPIAMLRRTQRPRIAGACSLLGYLDSNQEQLNQNQPCCQLHHTPRKIPGQSRFSWRTRCAARRRGPPTSIRHIARGTNSASLRVA